MRLYHLVWNDRLSNPTIFVESVISILICAEAELTFKYIVASSLDG